MNNPLREGSQNGQYAAVIPENRRYEYMYDENERNERHDQDVDYTEGALFGQQRMRKRITILLKKKKLPIMAVIMIPVTGAVSMENRRQQPEQIRKRMQRSSRNAAIFRKNGVAGDMALRILVRKLRHL